MSAYEYVGLHGTCSAIVEMEHSAVQYREHCKNSVVILTNKIAVRHYSGDAVHIPHLHVVIV